MSGGTSVSGGPMTLHWTGADGEEHSALVTSAIFSDMPAAEVRCDIVRDPQTGELMWTPSGGA